MTAHGLILGHMDQCLDGFWPDEQLENMNWSIIDMWLHLNWDLGLHGFVKRIYPDSTGQ